MKKSYYLAFIFFALFAISSCGVSQQTKSIKALEKCSYEIYSADSIFLGDQDVLALLENRKNISVQDIIQSNLGGLAFSFLTGELPLIADLQLKIHNPTRDLAGINQFQYKIAIEDKLIAEGTSDLPIRVAAQGETIVPVKIKANIFPVIQDKLVLDKLSAFLTNEEKVTFTFSIKPTLSLFNQQIDYPNYITFNKTISRSQLQF